MSTSTSFYKNAHGNWQASTIIMLSDKLQFTVSTSKRYNGELTTTASVGHVSEDGNSIMHAVFEDYCKTLHAQRYSRITQAVVKTQHASVMNDLNVWVNEARAHYGLELQNA